MKISKWLTAAGELALHESLSDEDVERVMHVDRIGQELIKLYRKHLPSLCVRQWGDPNEDRVEIIVALIKTDVCLAFNGRFKIQTDRIDGSEVQYCSFTVAENRPRVIDEVPLYGLDPKGNFDMVPCLMVTSPCQFLGLEEAGVTVAQVVCDGISLLQNGSR